jgi:hypothetical protein
LSAKMMAYTDPTTWPSLGEIDPDLVTVSDSISILTEI